MGLIRIILAIFVIVFHCGNLSTITFMQGNEAVQTFYIISGFYMALILNEKYSSRANAYRLFLSNRLLKLLPIYWLTAGLVLLTSAVYMLFSKGDNWFLLYDYKMFHTQFSIGTWAYLVFTNLFVIGQDVALFLGIHLPNGTLYFTNHYSSSTPPVYSFMLVPQAWTISLEIMFYLIAPFIVRKKTWLIFLLFLAFAIIKLGLKLSGLNYDPWNYRFFPAELMYFFMGILSYKFYLKLKTIQYPKWFLPLSFYSVLFVILGYEYLHAYIKNYAFFTFFAFAIPFVFMFSKKSNLDRKLGEFSYPLYISHIFIKSLVLLFIGVQKNVSLPVVAGSFVFALLANEIMLKRIERYRQTRVITAH